MKDCKQLFDTIDGLYGEFVKIWEDVCNIESPTEYKEGVDAVGRYFINYAENQGWDVEIFEQTVSGNPVCITMNSDADKSFVTLSGHIDTVHPVGSFGIPAVTMDEKYIYGPGVTDCKGGTVAALMAMTALKQIGFNSRPVRLILQTDEEDSSLPSNGETVDYMCRKAEGSRAFLNCESIRGDTLVLWRKGICRYRFEISGKSIHASRCAEGGASAITEAAHKILRLEKMKDRDGITCNCGLINGGTAPNTVPDNCAFIAEIRFNSNEEWQTAEKEIYSVAEKSFVEGTKCKVIKVSSRPSMDKSERNFELLDELNEIYAECSLPVLTARQSLGGSDAAQVTCSGIPCVDSIGVAGDKIHTPEEYAVLSSLTEAAKRLAAVCAYI